MKPLGLLAIRFYQRFISPYKGFRCAYSAYTGCASCSGLGYRVVQRYGIWHGIPLIRKRFSKCYTAHQRLLVIKHTNINKNIPSVSRLQTRNNLYSLKLQAGDCDIDFCDVVDLLSHCDSCGSDNNKSKKKQGNPQIPDYIPPQRK